MTHLSAVSGVAARPAHHGRLGVYATLGGSTGAIPLPWVPRAMLSRVRGALLHDLAASHGLTLTREARDALSDPRGPKPTRRLAFRALQIVGERLARRTVGAFGPIAFLRPLRGATQTYILGRLFDRYLQGRPTDAGHAIDAEEAFRIRSAIDAALVRAFTVGADAASGESDVDPAAGFADRMLQHMARIPERLTRRLDAAFDDLISHDSP